jgi:hypothetical protein
MRMVCVLWARGGGSVSDDGYIYIPEVTGG